MIEISIAKEKIVEYSTRLEVESRLLTASAGYVLAQDIIATLPLPLFTQSAMDGYAIRHDEDRVAEEWLTVQGESKAGSERSINLEAGKAVRIFTGAPLPQGATAVVMQEHVTRQGDRVKINLENVADGAHIRYQGQQIQKGEVALPMGSLLSPGAIGFLAGFGITHVAVYRKPKVAILVTGDELVDAGQPLKPGEIYESNSAMLEAALLKEGVEDIRIDAVHDDKAELVAKLDGLLKWADLVITSGGISVGDYDYVGEAIDHLGVQTVFYKVKQRPGKPLFFGEKGGKLLFALPGNPASSLVCFYEYVFPALRLLYGRKDIHLQSFRMPSLKAYSFKGERDEFLKGLLTPEGVMPLYGQESFALRSFALANALIYLPASQQQVLPGDLVEVHVLPS
ncbi:molybdopterin molybdotransferase [Dyadobacter jejuensis]|uniref:Molybdopterin molybdenumtransferase n=1 Tax=Dyadobacter jejuensis TaxID=1082580 RepID=A0A316ARV3_9BACT|nr:gephyrin-like molybdotransferase Glp [Dyadobacter jejuensis]PWJ60425.1 molybdopterin molybdotransferase [Dyadobacter jejuensis]